MGDLPEKHNLVIFIIRFKPHYLCNIRFIRAALSYYGISKLTIAKMAGVEENDIDRLLVNPPEKVEIEVKYKIDVTVMEGVSQTILKKVILVLLKISRMIKSKCTFRFSGCS